MRNKYKAVPKTVDSIKFASTLEAARYKELKLLERAGKIIALQLQVRFPLQVMGITIGHYISDFRYFDKDKQMDVVEDCKGHRLPLYIWKSKHFKAQHGYAITEIRKVRK